MRAKGAPGHRRENGMGGERRVDSDKPMFVGEDHDEHKMFRGRV